MTELPAAVLWDMDGTLVDTEPYWIATEFELAAEHGATWSREQALALVGNDLVESGRYIQQQMGLTLSPAEIVERLLDGVIARVQESVPWRPGARELLADLRHHDVPCALVTMSYRRFAGPIVDQLPAGTFDVVVTGDQVTRGKPHPEPYLTAARLLGVSAPECLAIEDSDTGATSAETAGCTVIAVPNHVPVTSGPGRILIDSLVGESAGSLTRRCLTR
ncbi:HAD family hydrolase [Nocardioides limicola]|uniref:HAD family hydrolase n=1 Tax=Nocardioides limicola TaxID=2803368 RepID=UPI00193B389A|nr:HAD family phosphatase [Nocardioides sp. DJM-14]